MSLNELNSSSLRHVQKKATFLSGVSSTPFLAWYASVLRMEANGVTPTPAATSIITSKWKTFSDEVPYGPSTYSRCRPICRVPLDFEGRSLAAGAIDAARLLCANLSSRDLRASSLAPSLARRSLRMP
eukprot:scaffold5720_cov127-Isochrysis_galbana.AAC.3